MKIYDAHIHAAATPANPEKLLAEMERAGVYGGCIFSNNPKEYDEKTGTSFDERLKEVLSWTAGHEDRLFPVIWIHPYEENIIENIRKAVEKGVCAFKIICNNFYVHEERCIEVLQEIARLDKPVFFHSGILWCDEAASEYNRPLHWEKLKNIKGLRFSMAHCSWPWTDECIAIYGEFLETCARQQTAEMFFDTTPGTPVVYRKGLLERMYFSGYDSGHNIMFGTDALAHEYNAAWSKKWLDTDGKIMDELGVSKANREGMYCDNLLRFLGKTKTEVKHAELASDNADSWSPINKEVAEIIEKWYKKLNFPKIYDSEFYKALSDIKISDAISVDTYTAEEEGSARNLLSFLYFCEELKNRYEEKGISEEILCDTLGDILVWTHVWTDLKCGLCLGTTEWLKRHLSMQLFKLGRLQFCMGKAEHDVAEKNIKKGDNVLEIHIPETGPLANEECLASIEAAKEFFAKYYPEFEYEYFTCHSWLLDPTLKELAKPESNVLKFQNMFEPVEKEKSDAILRYVFKWNTTRYNVKHMVASSGFAEKIKKHIMSGNDFYEVTGVIKK